MITRIIVGNFSTNCYLLQVSKSKCIIIDPGAQGEKIAKKIIELNLSPILIICTHGHLDHISAIGSLINQFSSPEKKLELAVPEKDKWYFGKNAKEHHFKAFSKIGLTCEEFNAMYHPIPAPTFYLENNKIIKNTPLLVLPTPGHTPGSVSLLLENQRILFSGDCIMKNGIGRTDLPGGSLKTQINSIENIILKQDNRITLLPGHGEETTIKQFKTYYQTIKRFII